MFCPKCGEKNIEGAKFCAKCGTKVDNSVPVKTSKVKKEGNTEKFILMLGVFLVLFSLVFQLILTCISPSYSLLNKSIG